MAARPAVLIALAAAGCALLGGCLRSPRSGTTGAGCAACHAVHYAREGSCSDCHRGRASATRKELAHERLLRGRAAQHGLAGSAAQREGARLVDALACRRCHAIAGAGNRLATELDRVVWQREQDALVASVSDPVAGMPAFGLDRPQAEAIVAFLLRSGERRGAQDAYSVRFERRAALATTVFERRCGPCHRVLTPSGLLGTGNAGPNLSGLFTAFYPKTALHDAQAHAHAPDAAWTQRSLGEWLRNPRAARAATTMPPLALSDADLRELLVELGAVD